MQDQINIYQPTTDFSIVSTTKNSTVLPEKSSPATKHYLLPTGSPRKPHAQNAETRKNNE